MSSIAHVRLTCQTCARRKIKCDKGSPCANCARSSIPCISVERRRLPRGRTKQLSVQQGQIISDRLAKLEHLLEAAVVPTTERTAATWCSGDSTKCTEHTVPSGSPYSEMDSCDAEATKMRERSILLDIFFRQVDPILKILHRPSLFAYLGQGTQYLNYQRGDPVPAALAAAVFYVSSATLTREQCLALFDERREIVVSRYQEETKAALARVDFLVTNDLTVLQAFVLSLVAARTHDRSRRMWTMLGVALRIAQALSLHLPEPPFPMRPFEREMRRRLWHLIGWLDVEATLDRVSEPMMRSAWIQPHHLANINDEEYGFETDQPLPMPIAGAHPTDSTLFIIISHAQYAFRILDLSGFAEPGVIDVLARQQTVDNFRHSADALLAGCDPDSDPFHWFITQLKERIHAVLQLLALRPLGKSAGDAAFPSPDGIPSPQVLSLAADILEQRQRMYSDRRAELWRWFEPLFFPWHALAVALNEVCACAWTEGSRVDTNWHILDNYYNLFLKNRVDTPHDRLWRYMQDLMGNARAVRAGLGGGLVRGTASQGGSEEGLQSSEGSGSTDKIAPVWQDYLQPPDLNVVSWAPDGQFMEPLETTGDVGVSTFDTGYFSTGL